MASELQLYTDTVHLTGRTFIARLFNAGTQVGSDISLTETGSTGIYIGDMPSVAAGTYVVRFILTGGPYEQIAAHGEISWDGTAETGSGLTTADLNTAVSDIDTAISNIDTVTETDLNTVVEDLRARIANIQAGSLIGSRSKTD